MNYKKNDVLVFAAILSKQGESIEAIKNFIDFIERVSLEDSEVRASLDKLLSGEMITIENGKYSAPINQNSEKITLSKVKVISENILGTKNLLE